MRNIMRFFFFVYLGVSAGLTSCANVEKPQRPSLPTVDSPPPESPKHIAVEENLLATVEAAEKLGVANPLLLSTLYSLAEFYRDQGSYAKAEVVYRRCLALKEGVSGPNHPDVATILEQYASLLTAAKRPAEAAPLETRARAIRAQYSSP